MTDGILTYFVNEFETVEASNNEIAIQCPFCTSEKQDRKLYYNTHKDVFNCFRCGTFGRGLDFIMLHVGCDARTAASIKRSGVEVPTLASIANKIARTAAEAGQKIKKQDELNELPEWFIPLLPTPIRNFVGYDYVLKYAQRRGFSSHDILTYNLGFAPVTQKQYRNRLIIPVERGFFQARTIFSDILPKYKNPNIPKNDRMWNHKVLGAKHLVVCEGILSAKAIIQRERRAAVAVLGKSVNDTQARRIAASGAEIVEIAFDPGTFNTKPVIQFAKYLSSKDIKVYVRHYTLGDPDETAKFKRYLYNVNFEICAKVNGHQSPVLEGA